LVNWIGIEVQALTQQCQRKVVSTSTCTFYSQFNHRLDW